MKRLNVEDSNVFNKWRALYSDLSDQEQMEFYDDLEKTYPDQKSFTKEFYDAVFFKHAGEFKRVVEVGGWKGELASYCFDSYKIESWVNIELCRSAIAKTVPVNGNYVIANFNKFKWWNYSDFSGDVFIASHFIEHISNNDFRSLIEWIAPRFDYVLFEAPLNAGENNWENYLGTHILKFGWNDINKIMAQAGFNYLEPEEIKKDCFMYYKAK